MRSSTTWWISPASDEARSFTSEKKVSEKKVSAEKKVSGTFFIHPKIPTRAFAANALYLEVIRLAYNLVTAFQRTWHEEGGNEKGGHEKRCRGMKKNEKRCRERVKKLKL